MKNEELIKVLRKALKLLEQQKQKTKKRKRSLPLINKYYHKKIKEKNEFL